MLKFSIIFNLLFLTMVCCVRKNVYWKQPMMKFTNGSKPSVNSIASHIIGGNATTLGTVPYQASLLVYGLTAGDTWFCGGSLIHLKWVLTAAHCVDGAALVTVRLGSLTPLTSGTALNSTSFFMHPAYTDGSVHDDIALIQLPVNAPATTFIKVVPILPFSRTCNNATMRTLRVSGWGKTSDNATSIANALNVVFLTEITDQVCLRIYGAETIVPTIVCTWGNSTRSTCNGDSGGPAVQIINNVAYLVGSVSFGAAESCVNYPSGFIETPPYRDWIRDVTGINTL